MHQVNTENCCSHTVLVLDHNPQHLKQPGAKIDFESSGKSKHSHGGGTLNKTIWTISCEAAIEYCRIVYDVMPEDFMVQVISSDYTSTVLNKFVDSEQTISQILKSFASMGNSYSEREDGKPSLYPGLEAACQSLLDVFSEMEQYGKVFHGRIICLTSLQEDKDTKPLFTFVEEKLEKMDNARNVHIDLVIVNASFTGEKLSQNKKEFSPNLTTSVVTFKSHQVPSMMSILTRKHYSLSSTTVTGIPMKEEQHAGSSANYDVELIHPAAVHHEIDWLVANSQNSSGIVSPVSTSKKDNLPRNTVTLKWCTPKNNSANELQQCVGTYRVTPAEVNSRPAACLISFLQQGKTVMLEHPRKSGIKVISHMLASHGGEVFIHVLTTGRSAMEDPPSISEGCGGRVTDYRIGDFGKFMKENRLAPSPCDITVMEDDMPNPSGFSRLERCTRHWPMVISDTLVFNMPKRLEPLLSLITKRRLTDEEVQDCEKVIYRLQAMEARNDTLPLPMISMRGKGSKREEQYRQLWNELSLLLEGAAKTSPNHRKIYECLSGTQESSLNGSDSNFAGLSKLKSDGEESEGEGMQVEEMAWKELDRYTQMTEREKKSVTQVPSDPRKRRNQDSGNEEVISPKKKLHTQSKSFSNAFTGSSGQAKASLLSFWSSHLKEAASSIHVDFEGRQNAVDGKTELYQEQSKETNSASLNSTAIKEWV